MMKLLLVLGLGITAIGLAMVGYGVPVYEFSFGNTLILAGTTAFVGGLAITGLALVVRQLQRIEQALASRPAAVHESARPVEPARESAIPPPPVAKVEHQDRRAGRREVPGFEGGGAAPLRPAGNPQPDPAPAADQAEWIPHPSIPGEAPAASAMGARAVARSRAPRTRPEPDPMAMAPAREPAPVMPRGPDLGELGQALAEPPPSISEPDENAPDGVKLYAPPRRRAPTVQKRGFDAIWPGDEAASATEPAPDDGMPSGEPGEGAEPEASPQVAGEPVALRELRGPKAATILKSGVVEGMAYTLYSDGSIEADTAQGIMRFPSVEELRAFLVADKT